MADRKPLRLELAQRLCRRLPPIASQRLRDWIYPRQASVEDDYEFVVRSVTGGQLRGVTSDIFSYVFGVHGYHGWRLLALAVALYEPGDTILEVGANVGTETVGFADIAAEGGGKVIAFEPLPALRSKLDDLVALNAYRNVTILPFAIGRECKTVEFVLPDFENSGIGYVVNDAAAAPAAPASRVKVELRTLDSMSAELGPSRIIFADIEGSEHDMLVGGRRYIAEHRPALVLEAHVKNVRQVGTTLNALLEELERQGYEAHLMTRWGFAPPELDTDDVMTWFCVHKSRHADLGRARSALIRCGLLPVVRGINPLALA